MKYESKQNLIRAIIWAVVFLAAIVGLFWAKANYAVIVISAVMAIVFLREYFRYERMK